MKSARSHHSRTQEELWKEFNSHFQDASRDKGKNINHHDFLDSSFLPKNKAGDKNVSRKTFFSKIGG